MAKAKSTLTTDTTQASDSAEGTSASRLKIQGLIFIFTQRYAKGHVLTADEAAVLNQTLGENLRNNFANEVRKALEALPTPAEGEPPAALAPETIAALEARFADYQASYVFKGPRSGPGPMDPLERETRKVAAALLRAKLAEHGHKTPPKEQFDELVERIATTRPEVRAEAQRRLEAAKSAGTDILEGLFQAA